MQTAKIFASGRSQAVRLPKEFRFTGTEVGIGKMGKMVVLYPKDSADDIFFESLGKFPDEFFESIEAARSEFAPAEERVAL
ncbi:MAG: type II toxin-antitoxin system VapB family antitoxin [Defluviitaleaceae bacterium]|nr:type II toxin-antitoxin system VapB family antitoxin [Defluviitaleaceae bacterium]